MDSANCLYHHLIPLLIQIITSLAVWIYNGLCLDFNLLNGLHVPGAIRIKGMNVTLFHDRCIVCWKWFQWVMAGSLLIVIKAPSRTSSASPQNFSKDQKLSELHENWGPFDRIICCLLRCTCPLWQNFTKGILRLRECLILHVSTSSGGRVLFWGSEALSLFSMI